MTIASSPKTTDPYRLKSVKGPEEILEPHPQSCSIEDLPDYVQDLKTSKPLAVDLFCGAGGLSLGIHKAGFEVILGCDIRPDSIATHRHHFPGCSHQSDLSSLENLNEISNHLNECGEISLVAGGPPCQPFSRNIRWRKHANEEVVDQYNSLNEGRRDLWESFLTVVEDVKPNAFLMENVGDIAQTGDQEIFRGIISKAENLGYRVDARLIFAWQYGVPQLRPRLFIAGTRIGACSPFKWPDVFCESQKDARTLNDAISDLPPLVGDWLENWQDNHSYQGPLNDYQKEMREWLPVESETIPDHIIRKVRTDDLETFMLMREKGLKYEDLSDDQRRYEISSRALRDGEVVEKTKDQKSFSNKYNILKGDEACLTITAHMSKDGYWYIHPEQNRTLSIREAARVQSFPDGFVFHGGPSHRFHQIGEAVAPLVGFRLGKSLFEALKGKDDFDVDQKRISHRQSVLDWYEEQVDNEVSTPWTKRKNDKGELFSDKQRAWNVFVGEIIFAKSKCSFSEKVQDYKKITTYWPDHLSFLNPSLIALRHKKFRGWQRLEKLENDLSKIAERLSEDHDWSDWVRFDDLKNISRDWIRHCLGLIGITTDRSCSTATAKLVAKLMSIPEKNILASRMLREINLGLLVGEDKGGSIYKALVACARENYSNKKLEEIFDIALPHEVKAA
ncbi:DNA cytosine methyltransferase [Prochlorococcus sp. MIT 0916]|uniref:DNA cytosine methyltransferase n=1 Tax=Prochlorococcus sp. MIT 0916 TaxID=3082521 RepID=UPI0039B4474D